MNGLGKIGNSQPLNSLDECNKESWDSIDLL